MWEHKLSNGIIPTFYYQGMEGQPEQVAMDSCNKVSLALAKILWSQRYVAAAPTVKLI